MSSAFYGREKESFAWKMQDSFGASFLALSRIMSQNHILFACLYCLLSVIFLVQDVILHGVF